MSPPTPESDLDRARLTAIRAVVAQHYEQTKTETPECDTVEKVRALRSKVLADIELILVPEWRPT